MRKKKLNNCCWSFFLQPFWNIYKNKCKYCEKGKPAEQQQQRKKRKSLFCSLFCCVILRINPRDYPKLSVCHSHCIREYECGCWTGGKCVSSVVRRIEKKVCIALSPGIMENRYCVKSSEFEDAWNLHLNQRGGSAQPWLKWCGGLSHSVFILHRSLKCVWMALEWQGTFFPLTLYSRRG